VLETLFKGPEFWDSRYFGKKFKTPYQYVISALRATGGSVTNVRPIQATLQQLGMPLYGCQTPDGYKNTESAWLNPDGMSRRLSVATLIANRQFPSIQPVKMARNSNPSLPSATPFASNNAVALSNSVDANQLITTLGDRFSDNTRQAIASSPPQLRTALLLGSPEFMRR
jgi:uncharacterized protein (DUF1800 family)